MYDELDSLSEGGFVEIIDPGGLQVRNYRLTSEGLEEGERAMNSVGISDNARRFAIEAVDFVRSLSFSELVASIYNAYPDMKVNSVFLPRT